MTGHGSRPTERPPHHRIQQTSVHLALARHLAIIATARCDVDSASDSRVDIRWRPRAEFEEAIRALRAKRPGSARPDEIVATLDTIPDMRKGLAAANPSELAELAAFDATDSYDKLNRRLELAATVTPALVAEHEQRHPCGAVAEFRHSGAGLEPDFLTLT